MPRRTSLAHHGYQQPGIYDACRDIADALLRILRLWPWSLLLANAMRNHAIPHPGIRHVLGASGQPCRISLYCGILRACGGNFRALNRLRHTFLSLARISRTRYFVSA